MDHILILKYCNFVSVSLDSDTRPLMIPVCTAHPSPLMLRALGLESYLKLRTCKASSLVQLSHLDHFVFQFPLLFEFSIFTLYLIFSALSNNPGFTTGSSSGVSADSCKPAMASWLARRRSVAHATQTFFQKKNRMY